MHRSNQIKIALIVFVVFYAGILLASYHGVITWFDR